MRPRTLRWFAMSFVCAAAAFTCAPSDPNRDAGTLGIAQRSPENASSLRVRDVIDTRFSASLRRDGIRVSTDCVEVTGQDPSLFDLTFPADDTIRLTAHAPLMAAVGATLGLVFHSPCVQSRDGALVPGGDDHSSYAVPSWIDPFPSTTFDAQTSCVRPALALAADGSIFAACTTGTNEARVVTVVRIDRDGLHALGTTAGVSLASDMLHGLVLDSAGAPYVLYALTSATSAPAFQLTHWNGSAFESLGASFTAAGYDAGNLVLDSTGAPVFATADGNGVYVHRWNGTSIEAVGAQPIPTVGSEIFPPTLALGMDQQLYEAFARTTSTGSPMVTVRRFDGTAWSDVGTPFDGWGETDFVFDSTGAPVVLVGVPNRDASAARRFDGTQWQPLGAPFDRAVTDAAFTRHMYAGADHALYVMSAVAADIVLFAWNGTAWTDAFPHITPSESRGGSAHGTFAMPADGVPLVLLEEGSANAIIGEVLRLNR